MTELQRLQKAWGNAPIGSKAKLYFMFPDKYSNQKIKYWLENGNKDESVITQLISDLKFASDSLTKEIISLQD